MKKTQLILLVLLYISIAVTAVGQNFEWVAQEASTAVSNTIEPLDDGRFLLGCSLKYGSNESASAIYLIDSLGEEYSLIYTKSGESVSNQNIFYQNDNAIFLVHALGQCDVDGAEPLLEKINIEGEFFWDSYIAEFNLTILWDSLIMLAGQNGNPIIDINGTFTGGFNTPFISNGLLKINESTVLFYGYGGYVFKSFNANGSVDDINTVESFFIDAERLDNGNYVFLRKHASLPNFDFEDNDGLTLTNQEGTITKSIDFNDLETFPKITTFENKIYAFGKRDSLLIIKIFDAEINEEGEFIIGNVNITPKDIKQKNGKLYLTGDLSPIISFDSNFPDEPINNIYPRGSLWTKVMDIDNMTNDVRPDIGISKVQTDSFIILDPNLCSSFYTISNSINSCLLKNTSITLSNFGETNIDDVTINSVLSNCIYFCGSNQSYIKTFTDLNLAPNQDTILYLGDIGPTSLQVGSDKTYEFCFWTSAPDNKMDANPNNNGYCWIEKNISVGITDIAIDTDINIYPNPAQNRFLISLNERAVSPNTHIELLNINGQTVLSKTIDNPSLEIDISGLNNGIYYVRFIQDGAMIYGEKLVKM